MHQQPIDISSYIIPEIYLVSHLSHNVFNGRIAEIVGLQIQNPHLLHHSQAFISGSKESLISIDRVGASQRKVRELFSLRTNLVGNAKDGRVHL